MRRSLFRVKVIWVTLTCTLIDQSRNWNHSLKVILHTGFRNIGGYYGFDTNRTNN